MILAQRVQVFPGDMPRHVRTSQRARIGHLAANGQGNLTELVSSLDSLDSGPRLAAFWSRFAERTGAQSSFAELRSTDNLPGAPRNHMLFSHRKGFEQHLQNFVWTFPARKTRKNNDPH